MEKANFHIVQMEEVYPFERYIQLEWGCYRGSRIGIYCFNNIADAGYIDVDEFIYLY